MFENLIGPINNLEDGYLRELELLEKQQRLNEDVVEVESRIRACFERFAEAVDNLDSDGVRALLRRFKIRIVGTKERMVVMGVVAPRYSPLNVHWHFLPVANTRSRLCTWRKPLYAHGRRLLNTFHVDLRVLWHRLCFAPSL